MISLDTPLCMMTLGQLLDAIDEYKYTSQLDKEYNSIGNGLDIRTPIDELDISIRLLNRLSEGMHCFTLEDVLRKSPREFRRIRNFGPKTYNELKHALLKYGHQIGELYEKEDI